MGYVAVTGGAEAIEQADEFNRYCRLKDAERSIAVSDLEKQLRLLTDRVMGEGGLYAREYAALALKQAEGDLFEAAFLVRSYRSTLARNHYSLPVSTAGMRIIRRISSAFRDVPGGQILGPTYDYTHRMLNFELTREDMQEIANFMERFHQETRMDEALESFPKVVDHLRRDGLLGRSDSIEEETADITRQRLKFPYPRSARLQTMARGETATMVSLAYSAMRGYGSTHPTIAELRVGYVDVHMPHPYESEDEEECLYLGDMLLTEAETVNSIARDERTGRVQFRLGYGLVFGQNELKAIAMSILDHELITGGTAPAQDEEFVMMHIDSVDSGGFVSHLKLPHYVGFNSKMDVLRHGVDQRERRGGLDEDEE